MASKKGLVILFLCHQKTWENLAFNDEVSVLARDANFWVKQCLLFMIFWYIFSTFHATNSSFIFRMKRRKECEAICLITLVLCSLFTSGLCRELPPKANALIRQQRSLHVRNKAASAGHYPRAIHNNNKVISRILDKSSNHELQYEFSKQHNSSGFLFRLPTFTENKERKTYFLDMCIIFATLLVTRGQKIFSKFVLKTPYYWWSFLWRKYNKMRLPPRFVYNNAA